MSLQQSHYVIDFIESYVDENNNPIKIYRIIDIKNGISCTESGIHQHKIIRKGIKKIRKQIKEQERSLRK